MALSSLGAQLAALHSKSTENPGVILASSKRKADSVGRGVTYSSQHGHRLLKSNVKPSILSEDSKAAADVPLSTLRENAFSSMHQLRNSDEDIDPYLHFVNLHSLQQPERGRLTREENDQLDKSIRDLLYLIASLIQESSDRSSNSIYACCLHVMEYLLRRYEIHLRNVHDFVVAFLPHHEDVIFSRILRLVDLANIPTLSFLRPYAASGNGNPGRSLFAKRCSKDLALLKLVCQTVQRLRSKQRRGASRIHSFCCAVVMEAMTLQSRNSGSLEEPTVRVLMPFCQQACSCQDGGDWRAFGMLLTSTLVEYATLSPQSIEKLAEAVVKGGVTQDAIILLTTLFPQTISNLEIIDKSFNCLSISDDLFLMLTRVDSIQDTIGELNSEFDFTVLVSTLLDLGLKHQMLDFVMKTISAPSLSSLWITTSLISSVVATTLHLVAQSVLHPKDVRPLMNTLKQASANQYDKGVAYIITKYHDSERKTKQLLSKALDMPFSKRMDDIKLPANVALEHADASIRMEAMQELVNQCDDYDSLLLSLLRHFILEEDPEMVLFSGSSIEKLLQTKNVVFNEDACPLLVDALNKFNGKAGKELELALNFAGHALKNLLEHDSVYTKCLFVMLVAHFNFDEENKLRPISVAVSKSICNTFSESRNDFRTCRRLIATKPIILDSIITIQSKISAELKAKAFWSLIECISLESHSNQDIPTIGAWKATTQLIHMCSNELIPNHDVGHASKCIELALKGGDISKAIELLSGFAAVKLDSNYKDFSIPMVNTILGKIGVSRLDVVFEVALRLTTSPNAVLRLLDIIQDDISQTSDGYLQDIVRLIALCGHPSHSVREATLKLFTRLTSNEENKFMTSLIEEHQSQILLDGASALPNFLRGLISSNESPLYNFQNQLLKQCVHLMTLKWLPIEQALGSANAISVFLSAAELSGESTFSLMDRWIKAGSSILDRLLKSSSTDFSIIKLIEVIVQMLKGVIVENPAEILGLYITSGPSLQGTRARSYSVGRTTGVSFLNPYPKVMLQAIKLCLNQTESSSGTAFEVCKSLVQTLFSSESWREYVFKNFKKAERIAITQSLLLLLSTSLYDEASSKILLLPLDISDLVELLDGNKFDLRSLSIIIDCIRSNSKALSKHDSLFDLISSLFIVLKEISSSEIMVDEDEGEIAFSQHSLLSSLLSLLESVEKECPRMMSQKKLKRQTTLLVTLVGNYRGESIRELSSWKARTTALKLLSRLCELGPSIVVNNMAEAILACASSMQFQDSSISQHTLISVREVLSFIIPVFHRFHEAGRVSILGFLNTFLERVDLVTDSVAKKHLLQSTTMALASTGNSTVITYLMMLLFARASKNQEPILQTASDLSKFVEQPILIRCTIDICTIASDMLPFAFGNDETDINQVFGDISAFLFDKTFKRERLAKTISMNLCGLIRHNIELPSMGKYLTTSENNSLILQLWQGLLTLQLASSNVQVILDSEIDLSTSIKKAFESCKESIQDTLRITQFLIPIPVFLASTASLIEDKGNEHLRVRALRLLAERASEISYNSAEASLFLDLLPIVVEVYSEVSNESHGVVLQQAAAIVVEQFARTFGAQTGVVSQKATKLFVDAFMKMVSSLHKIALDTLGNTILLQLACSVALCISTLIQLLKARCLSSLPLLVDSLLLLFDDPCLSVIMPRDAQTESELPRLLQISLIRVFSAMTESVPQFLIPHLDKILMSKFRLYLIENVDLALKMAKKIPSRQLLPSANRALKNCASSAEFSSLLNLIKVSIDNSPQAEMGTLSGHVLQSIFLCCEQDITVMDNINQVFITLVLKLSEMQLRPLYAKMRLWRDESQTRKLAFWSLSSALAKELKSIFLPYLSTSISDALQDLDYAVGILCSSGKTKKVKLGPIDSLHYLPDLISCLGHSFAADAREGGSWMRDDGENRYNSFREPLSSLLHAKIPKDFPFKSGPVDDPYHKIVVDEEGLISCLVHLATAAGNDVLWKPLNHSVLDACGNEDRLEVKRAGLTCLLKLMQTLGEEYMVLLPECLPVLSELLESDEGTAAIARDCVDLAEDLLGESLEDSLR